MKNLLAPLILFTLILAGCGAPTPTPTPFPTATVTPEKALLSNPGSGSLFAISEIGLGPNGYVSLTNFTGQPASLSGLFLCQGSKCFELPNAEVPAGSTVRVALGDGSGLESVVATEATIGELRPSDGEMALYTSENVNDPKSILAYLEWGSTPHINTNVAMDAGLWINGSFAPSSNKATRLFRNEGGLWLFDE